MTTMSLTSNVSANCPPLSNVMTQWYVMHTKSRQEKALAQSMGAMGITYFLPLISQLRSHAGRRVRVEMPLFSGYIFIHGSREDAYACDRTRRVAQIIDIPDQQQFENEINNIRIALATAIPIDPFPLLHEGVKVTVRSGPLQGMIGMVESRTKLDRLILKIDVLGQACSLEIDSAILDVLD